MTTLQTEVLVVGGGGTGAGIAWDAALRGYDVILVDRADLAEGTSGRFHGLLHSGGRYVVKDPIAARECVEENAIVRGVASAAIEDTGGLFVTTPDDDPAYGDQFLAGCAEAGLPTEEIDVAEALRREPMLNPGIKRAFTVADASVDVWLLVWGLANGAATRGARILPYHRCVELRREGDAVTGARLHDERTGETVEVEAGFTINAGGAWAHEIAQMAGIEGVSVVPGKGIMIAMNHRLVNTVVNRCTMPADGDIIVPIRTVSVIGTTDIRSEHPDDLPVTQEEVDAMLDDGERLVPGFRHHRALRVWAGVRPLFDDQKAGGSTRDVSRGTALLDHGERDGVSGFITITGGKLTTYRLMAEEAVDAMVEQLGHDRPCTTKTTALPGSEDGAYMSPGARLRARDRHLKTEQLICECELIERSTLEAGDAGARLAEPRRHPPQPATGHGAVPGRLLHLRAPPGSSTRSTGSRPRRPTRACARSSRSAGRACTRSSTATSCARRGWTTGSSRASSTWSTCPASRSGTSRRRPRGRRHEVGRHRGGRRHRRAHRRGPRRPSRGKKVLVLAKGAGATHLSPLTLDVLGYAPERVESPAASLGGFLADNPDHPYARTGEAAIGEALAWFADLMADGYPYTGGLERNILLPSRDRRLRPSALVPVTMAEGDLRRDEPDRRRRPAPAQGLPRRAARRQPAARRACPLARSSSTSSSTASTSTRSALARALDRPEVRSMLAAQLAVRLKAGERVGFPAVLGLRHAHTVWSELQDRLGRPVFEIPTVPPSVPGLRVDRILTRGAARCRRARDPRVRGRRRGARRRRRHDPREAPPPATSSTAPTGSCSRPAASRRARSCSTPTGGRARPCSTCRWRTCRRPGEPRFVPDYFDVQPMARVGVAVDAGLRPVGARRLARARAGARRRRVDRRRSPVEGALG